MKSVSFGSNSSKLKNLFLIIAETDKKEQGFLSICGNLIFTAGLRAKPEALPTGETLSRRHNFFQRAFHFKEFLLYL